jgi:hypothetical protein
MAKLIQDWITRKEYNTDVHMKYNVREVTNSEGVVQQSYIPTKKSAKDFDSMMKRHKLPELTNAVIKRISVYKECGGPALMAHALVLMEASDGFWCLERYCHVTHLRHAKSAASVIDYSPSYMLTKRQCEVKTEHVAATGTVADVVQMIYDEGLSSQSYDLRNNNCRTMADKVFSTFKVNQPGILRKKRISSSWKKPSLINTFKRFSNMVSIGL